MNWCWPCSFIINVSSTTCFCLVNHSEHLLQLDELQRIIPWMHIQCLYFNVSSTKINAALGYTNFHEFIINCPQIIHKFIWSEEKLIINSRLIHVAKRSVYFRRTHVNLFLWQAVCFIRKAHQAEASRRTHVIYHHLILVSSSCKLVAAPIQVQSKSNPAPIQVQSGIGNLLD